MKVCECCFRKVWLPKWSTLNRRIFVFQRKIPKIFRINILLARLKYCHTLDIDWFAHYIAAASQSTNLSQIVDTYEIFNMDLQTVSSQVDTLFGMYYESSLYI